MATEFAPCALGALITPSSRSHHDLITLSSRSHHALITISSRYHQGTEFQKYTHGSFATRASHPCRLFVRHDKPPGLLCYTNLSSRNRKEKSFPLDEISEVRDCD